MNAPEKFLAKTAARAATGTSHFHESARAQVAGSAAYVDDIPEIKGTLHAAPILSTVAHGKLKGIDASVAEKMPGVRAVLLARDIPGDPLLATFVHDEPIFAMITAISRSTSACSMRGRVSLNFSRVASAQPISCAAISGLLTAIYKPAIPSNVKATPTSSLSC